MTSAESENLQGRLQELSPAARKNCETFLQFKEELAFVVQTEALEETSGEAPWRADMIFAENFYQKLVSFLIDLSGSEKLRCEIGITELEVARLKKLKQISLSTRVKFEDYVNRYLKKMLNI